MTETNYLIDNNALSRLSSAERTGTFFSQNCRLPADVLYEARGYVEPSLTALDYPTTISVLDRVREVMEAVPPGDTKLVDLYANKGAADPVIIACALDATTHDSETLFGSTWVVVTDDQAVILIAKHFGIKTMTSKEFIALVRGSGAG